MKKATKGWLIAAVSLVLVGAVLFAVVMTALHWDFNRLSTRKYETTTHAITESFTHISVTADTADIQFAPSEDDGVSVVCYEDVDFRHTVAVEGDTLVIQPTQSQKWYQHIGIGFASPTITVYLPAGEYGDLTVNANTGDVYLPADVNFESVDIAVSTGDVACSAFVSGELKVKTSTGDISLKAVVAESIHLSATTGEIGMKTVETGDLSVAVTTGEVEIYRVNCRRLTSIGNTGDILLRDVIATETFSIQCSTGDVIFDHCDAAELTVTTDTGDVIGSFLTQKTFITHTDTGNVEIPHTAPSGGSCEITTDTGNIYITLVSTD